MKSTPGLKPFKTSESTQICATRVFLFHYFLASSIITTVLLFPFYFQHANFYGSLTQTSTLSLGRGEDGDVNIPFKDILPMVEPTEILFDGKR